MARFNLDLQSSTMVMHEKKIRHLVIDNIRYARHRCFLEPLVDDFQLLFETGVETYDAHTQEMFTLCAVVLWTINDYPTLETYDAHIQSYAGHRRYLPYDHPFRR